METRTYLPGEVLEGVNWDQIEGNSSRTEEEGHCAHLVASSLATPGSQLLPPPPSPTTNRQTLSLSLFWLRDRMKPHICLQMV